MTLWAPEARRNTSCLVVATLRVALEIEGSVILVYPSEAKPYVHGTGIGIIDGVVTTPGKQLHIFITLICPVSPSILICNLLACIDVFDCDKHLLMPAIQRINAEIQTCIPMVSSKTVISIGYGTAKGFTVINKIVVEGPAHVSVGIVTCMGVIVGSAYMRIPYPTDDRTNGEH